LKAKAKRLRSNGNSLSSFLAGKLWFSPQALLTPFPLDKGFFINLEGIEHCSRTLYLPFTSTICHILNRKFAKWRILRIKAEGSASMIYIALGSLGLLIIYLFDIVSLKRIPGAKPVTWIAGSGLLAYSVIMVCLAPDKLPLPSWSIWLGWALLLVSLSVLIYSLFINLPFRKTYVATGAGDKLVTTGLYALVRHPGVHWLILIMLSLILVSRSSLMLIASPIWILLDILLVVIQDKFLFGRMFAGYNTYRQKTPMLVPNRRSISAFINSLKQTGA